MNQIDGFTSHSVILSAAKNLRYLNLRTEGIRDVSLYST